MFRRRHEFTSTLRGGAHSRAVNETAKLKHAPPNGPMFSMLGHALAQCHLLCLRATIPHKLWVGQSCPGSPLGTPFRRLFGPSASVRAPRAPAKSPPRRGPRPGLAAPQFMQTVYPRQSKWHCALACPRPHCFTASQFAAQYRRLAFPIRVQRAPRRFFLDDPLGPGGFPCASFN